MKTYQKIIILILVISIALATLIYFIVPQNKKRYAVFAGYNPDGTIHPYVITYLKALNEVSDGVVYIANSPLISKEEAKLKELTIHYENRIHGEYDFGSYKRGYNWLKDNGYLEKAKELIFANDSTFAPVTSFKPMFKQMSQRKDLDFWGDLPDNRYALHLQPHFLVFRKQVFQSETFADFINQVNKENHISIYILKYEVNLTPYLAGKGYKWDSYLSDKNMPDLESEDKDAYPLTLISKYNHQFLKRHTFGPLAQIKEDKGELLKYIEKTSPQLHNDIMAEIFPYKKDKK